MLIQEPEKISKKDTHETPPTLSRGDVYCQIGFGIIGRRDYLTLKRGEKITDEIINGMLHHQMQNRMDCFMFNSHFMSNYLSLSGPAESKFERVARWTRNVNLIAKKVISVPVCRNDHWYLLVAMDLESNPSLTILNSVPDCGDDQRAAEAFIEYLRVGFQVSGVRVYRPLLPTQSTRNDCGAFVVLYQRHILEDTDEFKVPYFHQLQCLFSSICYSEEAKRRQSERLVLAECGIEGAIQNG